MSAEAPLVVIDREQVRTHLTYERCIPLMRECMMALSRGDTTQVLRSIVDLHDGAAFGVMAGSLGRERAFGSKLVSVFPRNRDIGRQSHQGVITLFDPASGSPRCIIHAGEVTAIRTAAASAAATEVLARSDSSVLAVLGYGEQAWSHVQAISHVRPLTEVMIWGRSARDAADFAARVRDSLDLKAAACAQVADAVAAADIICTTTAAAEPILRSAWVRAGTHINAVGSSRAGPAEIDSDLVVRARFFADHRESVLRQGAEFLRAKSAGLIDDAHLQGEIGEVMLGSTQGRSSPGEVTLYKSLGNIVQDLACGEFLYAAALREGFGARATLE
jgi:ornithine cyclodeaminase/alanine dehydrogenase-like protein (mu-crystallin family)